MSKYTAKWSANGSTYGSFEGNNLRAMRKEAREICMGNVFEGNCGYWSIDYTGECNQEPICSGNVK